MGEFRFIITFLCGSGISAQTTDSIVQPEVYYSSPKTYEIGGIEVTGIADHHDPELWFNGRIEGRPGD